MMLKSPESLLGLVEVTSAGSEPLPSAGSRQDELTTTPNREGSSETSSGQETLGPLEPGVEKAMDTGHLGSCAQKERCPRKQWCCLQALGTPKEAEQSRATEDMFGSWLCLAVGRAELTNVSLEN